MRMCGFATIASSAGLVAIMHASALHSPSDAPLLDFRETVRGHARGTGKKTSPVASNVEQEELTMYRFIAAELVRPIGIVPRNVK